MKPKLILCLALVLSGGLLICSIAFSQDNPSTNDGFQLQKEIAAVEKAASDAALPPSSWTNEVPWVSMANALEELDRHYSMWSNSSVSISPRLSKAVLTIFPSLTNASVNPQPEEGQMWCNAVMLLGKSHDPAMVFVLRPYLKEKGLAGDGGNLGAGITTLRICDDAAMALNSLLNLKLEFPRSDMFLFGGHEVLTNGTNVVIWKSHSAAGDNVWSGSDPAWEEWDKKIVELQKRLDQPELYTEQFRIDVDKLKAQLQAEGVLQPIKQSVSNAPPRDITTATLSYFTKKGIHLDSAGENFYYNDHLATLYVRTTLSKLQKIRSILATLEPKQ